MGLADDMRDRICLERYIEGHDNIGHHYEPFDFVWAATEAGPDGRFKFRIRYRPDLREMDDLEPAMHLRYRGTELVVDDVVESIRGTESTIYAHREIVKQIDHLATGTRRNKSWP